MTDIGLAGAFIGGALTLLSPCSVMLLPAFFSYAFTSPGKLVGRTGIFYLGLAATLVPLGILAGVLGSLVMANRSLLMTVAAVVIIAFGLIQLLGIQLPFLNTAASSGGTSPVAVFLLGTVYGLAGACAGPILGAVITLAAMGGDPFYGGVVLAVYAAGMTLPLLIFAFLWGRFDRVQGWLKPRVVTIGNWQNSWTQIIGGLLAIGVGILIIATDGLSSIAIMSASQQSTAENWVMSATSKISDVWLVVGAVALLALVWGINWFGKRKQATNLDQNLLGKKE